MFSFAKTSTINGAVVKTVSRRRKGQGMTEYIIIVGLIAVFLIAAVQKLGGVLQKSFEGSTTRLEKDVLPGINGTGGAGSPDAKAGTSGK